MNSSLVDRGLDVAQFADREHGTRLRYMAGCKCLRCRVANTEYEKQRARARKAGDWNGIIPAVRAREHVLELGRAGIGYKQVAKLAGVGKTIVAEIRAGTRSRIRARTERQILGVTDIDANVAPKALVDARPTWALIEWLLREGYIETE